MKTYLFTPAFLVTNRGMQIFAVVLALAGFSIKYWIGRRRFYRRSNTGSEVFSSYEKMKLIRLGEGLGWLLANILIIVGIGLFLFILVTPDPSHK